MIPTPLKKKLEEKNFWDQPCVHSGECRGYGGEIEAEHCFFYGKPAIQEEWNIVPVAKRFNRNPTSEVKAKSRYYALKQAKAWGLWDEIKAKYPKKDWDFEWGKLSNKFEK